LNIHVYGAVLTGVIEGLADSDAMVVVAAAEDVGEDMDMDELDEGATASAMICTPSAP